MAELKIKATSEIIELENYSLSSDKEQFIWSFSANVATKEQMQKLVPPANLGQNYIEVQFTLGNDVFELIIEDTDSQDTNFSYAVSGKSKAIILAEPYADYLTKTWLNTTAQSICAELCTASGITLDWQILDWDIAYFKVDKRYPIDIINELVRDIGAKLQTLPNGTLTVLFYQSVSPGDLPSQTPLYTLDTTANIFERAERFINNLNYDCVFVTKDSSLLEAPSLSVEEISDGDDRILNIYPNPFVTAAELNLTHASGGNVSLTYVGEITERQTEDILVEAGEGRLSKNLVSLVNVKWQQNEVGELTIAENGRVSCSGGGTGLATVIYNTKYLQYRLQRLNSIAKTLLMSDELQPPVLTTGNNPMPPIVVKTLSSEAALTARANAELYDQYDVKEYNLNAAYDGDAWLCAKVARVNIINEELGFNGWIKSVDIRKEDDGEITQTVIVEMPCY